LLSRRRRKGRALELELFTVVVPSGTNGDSALLHLIAPAPPPALRRRRRGAAERTVRPGGTSRPGDAERGGPFRGDPGQTAEPCVRVGGDRLSLLSPREVEVLSYLGRGHSTRRIAEELCISPNTVRNHVRSILDKLQVHRRLEAALVWLQEAK
jgi:DNA-binding CsgD family transcriptional regulator